jgi:hypothetical protein
VPSWINTGIASPATSAAAPAALARKAAVFCSA